MSVREVQPFQLRYGSLTTPSEAGRRFSMSRTITHLARRVSSACSSRYDKQLAGPHLHQRAGVALFSGRDSAARCIYREERNPLTEVTNPFNVDRYGAVDAAGETEFSKSYVWSYGYRYERARIVDPAPGGLLNRTTTVSPLTSTFTRETRDQMLDAAKGAFLSQALSYSPSWLGSDAPFLKYSAVPPLLSAAAGAAQTVHATKS